MSSTWKTAVFFLLPFLLLLGSCKEENPKPEKLIPEDTYINLLVELQLLESYRSSTPEDSTSIDSLKSIVFTKYDATQEQFVESHRYYQKQVKPQKERISKAIDRLREKMVAEGLMDSTAIRRNSSSSNPR